MIRNFNEISFLSRLCFIKRRIQCFHEKRHHDRYLCERSDFYKIQFRDYFSTDKRFEQTIWNEWFKTLHLFFRHEDFQKSSSQIVNFESQRLRRTNITKSWNVKLQIFDHFHEHFLSIDQDLWWIHRWQKFQNKLSINREIINVRHVKNQIWYNLFNFNNQSLCF